MKEAESLYTSTLCAYEVLLGEKYNEVKGLKSSYIQVSLLFAQIETIALAYDDAIKASEIAAKLIGKGKKVDDIDILVAAQALKIGATVLTRDFRHFEILGKETGLPVERI
ncbi:MAG: type II toxin-antitoxin system VapC family toxin [Candidatus Micrarchaeales archaeon]|uniref:PIN domain-containing protein n=1 Tax=Candidatus Micrarchaeum acidiphilum ARMAN-2 TaxID=425595 RepID=C7DGA7_MICA2|nr:MAG: hypothetical protein UNLARM2_0111 [Candidatus Micrarchaeum acidiphilum ARMAN-2]MCW6161154.1 type II toxin-antitoxin system VapC family toxin [Candidatus Micrarchaeales archaeon]